MPTVPLPDAHDVTNLLHEVRAGRDGAEAALVALVYDELHAQASRLMRRERADHTLQPTALVHETYMRLMGAGDVSWQDRAHFFGLAARVMRRVLVEHARRRGASKRGGGEAERVTLDESVASAPAQSFDVLALDEALAKLAAYNERQARVVELRFFGALEVAEIAEALGVSPATVKRDWAFARAFLRREMEEGALR